MGKGLTGKRIVISGSRNIDEISTLIEKQGGIPLVRSLQGTVFLAEKEVEPDVERFIQEKADWAIFTTGIGTETLLSLAKRLGMGEQFLTILRHAKVASRGYKTQNVLKKLGVLPIAKDDDGTTRSLICSLKSYDFTGQKVMVQLHGETAPTLIKFLEEQGASVLQLLPYQHIPAETATIKKVCQELLERELDAICFTTAIQVRSLFTFAREYGYYNDILSALKEDIVAVAVGKVTAEALREEGVERLLAPKHERMGAMIVELSHYYESQLKCH
jgi:uroporphyrinogen-III synthase